MTTVASTEEIGDVIRARFGTQIEDGQSVSVQYDNMGKFDPPDGQTYVRLQIQFDSAFQVETGGPGKKRFRYPGLMTAQVLGVQGVGTQAGIQLADTIAAAFRARSVSGVTFRTATVRKVGDAGVPGRYQVDVDVPFYADILE